jgi:glucose uptake protein
MFTVSSLWLAVLFCVITMLGWGSWANTQKLAGKTKWPFELYYWDYAIGVFVFSLLFMFTLGSAGSVGMGALENLRLAGTRNMAGALLSGVIFNVSNILLVVAIDAAGMSVAFPVGVGLALVIGTVASFLQAPKGNPVAGPAVSYALGQGATLVAAIWGVVIWKEFRTAPAGTAPFVYLMFAGYALGLTLIGVATL